jgi:hypothetical protein
MIPYLFMFALPALLVLSPFRGNNNVRRLAWVSIGVAFTLLIGFRYQVGGDWVSYLEFYQAAIDVPFTEAVGLSDPGYYALNWLSALFGTEIYMVNLVCAGIVMTGVISFSRRQPLPWLALLVAVAYTLVVVAMGYTRQGVAIGLELLALVALIDGRFKRFVLFILLGALFHKTLMVMLPIGFLATSQNSYRTVFFGVLVCIVLSLTILAEQYASLWLNYVENPMVSDGGPVRVAMNALPAFIWVLFRKKFISSTKSEYKLWMIMAILSFACIPLVLFASTAVDRIALYFIPLQLYVFSNFHRLFPDRMLRSVAVLAVIFGYGTVLWVWLTFGSFSYCWLPYQMFPFVE